MKFILIVYMCMAGACEGVYEKKLYDTRALCEAAGQEVKAYAMETLPDSSGELYCVTQDEFEELSKQFDLGQDT